MMNNTSQAHRNKGSVAIELVSVMVPLAVLLTALLVFGRMIWHYSVVKSVASNTARYMAQGTWSEIKSGARAASAQAMAIKAVADAGIHGSASVSVVCMPSIFCNADPATSIVVGVQVTWDSDDDWFGLGTAIQAGTTVPYAN